MLEFLLSLLRQSKPSTLTAAGLTPNFILAHPLRAEADGDGKPDGDMAGGAIIGVIFSSLKRASCTKGFSALLGGDPAKNGGVEATGSGDCGSNS